MESYKTVKDTAEAFYEIQKSRFITNVSHAENEEEAREFLQQMKKKYFDARHNCSAWVLGEKGDKQKSNDDGEPGGTAGNPILETIKKRGLTNTVVVVTRYFGGIKLGAGGLIRAYGHSAALGLEASRIVLMAPLQRVRIDIEYNLLPLLENWIRQENILMEEPVYSDHVTLFLLLPPEAVAHRIEALTDLTSARFSHELLELRLSESPVPSDETHSRRHPAT